MSNTKIDRINVQVTSRSKRGLEYMVRTGESTSISDLVREAIRDMLKLEGVWNLPEVKEGIV